MAVKYLDTYTCYLINTNRIRQFSSLEEAKKFAEDYCGNSSGKKLFPSEESLIYGPGDGTTSVIIRRDVDWSK